MADQLPPVENVDKAAIEKLTVGPKAGDFVVVGDKHYTPKEIQALEKARTDSAAEVTAAKAGEAKWVDRIKKVYANAENPDKEALKEILITAGKSADEADALIAEATSDDEEKPAPKGKKGKEKEVEEEPEKKQDSWGTRAWLEAEFERAASDSFAGNTDLKKFVDAVRTRELAGEDTAEAKKAADEVAEETETEIRAGIATRANRIIQKRINDEGSEAFKKSPVRWVKDAMKLAAAEEARTARRRYGDPNKVGVGSQGPTRDPIEVYLEQSKPKAAMGKTEEDFNKHLTHAILSGMKNSKASV